MPADKPEAKDQKIYPITKYGAAVLEARTKTIEKFDDEFAKLCEDMFTSMYAAQGVGLAAPQIGIGKRLAVVDVTVGKNPEAKVVLANPEIIHFEGEQREEEGCLSVPGFRGTVARPQYVTVRAQDITEAWLHRGRHDLSGPRGPLRRESGIDIDRHPVLARTAPVLDRVRQRIQIVRDRGDAGM